MQRGISCVSCTRCVFTVVLKGDSGEIVCEEPLLTVDRQMGINIVHPEGKVSVFNHLLYSPNAYDQNAKTIFSRIRYDPHTDSSVIRCKSVPESA